MGPLLSMRSCLDHPLGKFFFMDLIHNGGGGFRAESTFNVFFLL